MAWFVLVLAGSYFIGSLSSAYLLAKLVAGVDLRHFGSGNIGISNMWEATHRRGLMPLVLVWDIGKGWLTLWLGALAGLDLAQAGAVAAVTLVGHNWPFYLGFKGGRGMLTTIGAVFALPFVYGYPPWPVVTGLGVLLIITALVRTTPLGTLAAVISTVVVSIAMVNVYPPEMTWGLGGILAVMLLRRLVLRRNAVSAAVPLWKVLLTRLLLDRDIRDRDAWVRAGQPPSRPAAF